MMYNYPFFSFPRFNNTTGFHFNQTPHLRNSLDNNLPYTSSMKYYNSYNNRANNKPFSSQTYGNGNYSNSNCANSNCANSNSAFVKNNYNTSANNNYNASINDNYTHSTKNSFNNDGDVLFELFGLKLYYDDVLLICLIFFLYKEGVQDQYLFMSLILLLMS